MVGRRSPGRARVVDAWRALTEPSSEVGDPSAQWRARLLASLTLAAIPVGVLLCAFFLSSNPVTALPWWALTVVPVVSLLATYAMARTRHWQWGAWLMPTVAIGLSSVEMGLTQRAHHAIFVALAITLGGMTLRKRGTLLLVGMALSWFLTTPWWAGAAFARTDVVLIASAYLGLGLVLGIGLGIRESIEHERLDDLAKSQARFQGLLEVAFEGLVELRDGCVVALNPGFVEIVGRPESELLGRELSAVLTLEDSVEVADRRASSSTLALLPQRVGTHEASGRRANGELFYVELVSRIQLTKRGPVEYLAVRDITANRQAALQLSIAHRAVALGTLSAGIAHEINNPLSWMMTNLQMAQDELRRGAMGVRRTPEQEGLLHTLDDALQGGRRVMAIVRDLKTMSREGGDQGVADVHAALDLACRIASRQIEARARLVRDYGHVPSVRGSAGRLGQVFLNLLTNAVQAIPEGERDVHRVTLRTRQRDEAVEVIVRDTGKGIPASVLPHIFDPFYTTKSKDDGTGLGLSITRSVIAGMGGTIEVESREGEGATFILRLPVAERMDRPSGSSGMMTVESPTTTNKKTALAAEPNHEYEGEDESELERKPVLAAAPTASIAAAAPAMGPADPKVRVLLIDDEPLLGKSLRRALSEHDVTFTEDPAHAIELCGQNDYDAIVCDLMMPTIGGEGVYEHLREHAPDLAARMIFMTGGAFTTGAQRFLESISNPVLIKPFTPNDLRVAVRRMLEHGVDGDRPSGDHPQGGGEASSAKGATA